MSSYLVWRYLGMTKQPVDLIQRRLNRKTNPVYAICDQQRPRSACASTQSNKRRYYSLQRWYNIYSCYIQNFKTVTSSGGWAVRICTWSKTPEDRFSHDVTQIKTPALLLPNPLPYKILLCLYCSFFPNRLPHSTNTDRQAHVHDGADHGTVLRAWADCCLEHEPQRQR